MFPLSKSCTTVRSGPARDGDEAAIATPGRHRDDGGDDDPARGDAFARDGLYALAESARERGRRSGIEAKRAGRRPRGHEEAPERVRLDVGARREALHEDERGQPAPQERGAAAALLGGWLAAFLVVKGFSERATIESGSFWRLLMPAWPAYLLLFAAIPLLVPTLARRLGQRVEPVTSERVSTRWIVIAAVATVLVPGVAIAASSPLSKMQAQDRTVVQNFPSGNILTPVDRSVQLDVRRNGSATKLTWSGGSWNAKTFYRVYRHDGPGDDTICLVSSSVGLVLHPLRRTDRDHPRSVVRRPGALRRPRPTGSGSGRTGSTTPRPATCSRSALRWA